MKRRQKEVSLDLLSTSQTDTIANAKAMGLSEELSDQIAMALEQSFGIQEERCKRGAPFIYVKSATVGALVIQGSCNDWTCPRCGQIRARAEYGRIVEGARKLNEDGHALYFWTLTCRGAEMPLAEAEANYLTWTNRLLTSARTKATRASKFWAYAQVTERQERLHPHSHLIASYCPPDAVPYAKGETLPNGRAAKHDCLWSVWFRDANVKAGLGVECDISLINSPVGVATYVSKYLFKDAMVTQWGKGWRRVRYSRSYPKIEHPKALDAYPLLTGADWARAGRENAVITCMDNASFLAAMANLKSDTLIRNGGK